MATLNERIDVFDKGYVILKDKMGDDLSVVNSARVSYNKESDSLTERDIKLIKFLAREGHTSPFRHAFMQFEIYAPLMVARQWWTYVVGSSHQDPLVASNESSRRYVTEEPVFFIPDAWREAPANSKQGSGEPVNELEQAIFTSRLTKHIEESERLYQEAMDEGICAEQARLFLPAYGMYVRWYWSASLQGVLHFLSQRLEHDAQKEIQEFAKAVSTFAHKYFPVATQEFLGGNE